MWNFVITLCMLSTNGGDLECRDFVMDYNLTHEDCFQRIFDTEMTGHMRAVGCELVQE